MKVELDEGLCPADGEAISDTEDQLAYMQTVIAVLVRRCGGVTVICPEELSSVIGCAIGLCHSEAGLELRTGPPASKPDDTEGDDGECADRPRYIH